MMSSEEDYKSNSKFNELPLLIYRNKTEEFKILKNKYLSNNKNGEDLIIIKFKQAALNISTVLNTDSLEINKMVHNCCICGSKFGKIFNKKQKCLVCNSIVCSSCNTNHIPLSSLNIISPNSNINNNHNNHNNNNQHNQQQSVQTCNVCFNSLGIIIKRFEFIKLNEIACNSDFVTFYEQMQLNIMDLKKNLPNFKSMVSQIQNSASPLSSKAKQLEQTISLHIKELESGIRQLKQLQGSTPKQNQVINNIKHSFATYLQTSIPEFKIASSNLTQKLLISVDTTNSIIKSSQNSPSQSHSHSQSPLSSSPTSSANASYTNSMKPLLKSINNEMQIDEPLLNSLSLKEINDEIRNRGFTISRDYRNKADVLKQLTDILNTEIYNIEIGDSNSSNNNSKSNNIQITKMVDSSTVSSSPPLFSSLLNSFSNLLNDKKSQPVQQAQPTQPTFQPITEAGDAKFENGTLTINGRLLTSLSLKEMNAEIRIRGLAIPTQYRNKPDVYLLLRDVLMDEVSNKSNVTSVVPAVCPQSGSFITITGDNLNKKSIEIKVGSVKIPPFKQNVNAIMFLSPSQPQEGEVELIISDGPNHILAKQFLFFTNSCFTTEDDISNVNDYALDMFQKSTTSPLLNSSSESSSSNNNNSNNNIQSNNSNSKQQNRMSSSPSSSNNNSPTLKPQVNNNSNNSSPILKSVNNNNSNNNNNNNNDSFSILMSREIGSTGKSFDDLIVEMIHPTVSPLSGTKVSVQFKNPIKSTIKVFLDSGIQIQNLEVSNAGNKLSFKTPPLSQGSHSIEFIQDSKRLYLDSILFYDSSISQQPSIQQFGGNSGFNNINNNNYNNNNNNNFMYQKEQPKIVTSSRVLGGKRN